MLAKPQTFMNLSGTSLKPLMEKHSLTAADLILVYDELALPWTSLRIKPRGSSAGHNGVDSVIRSLGTTEFVRVRLGIHPGHPLASGIGLFAVAVQALAAERNWSNWWPMGPTRLSP